jgi:hypothetical protein
MTIYDTPNLTSGIDDALVDVVGTVPTFVPMLLVFIFSTVMIGGMTSQKRRTGSADAAMWAVMASMSTFLVSLALTLKSGLIDLLTLSIVVAITIASAAWLLFSQNRREV